MKKQTLKLQLLFPIIIIFIIGVFLLFYISYSSLQKNVDKSQENLYNKKIDNIILLIEQKHKTLKKTQMIEAYEHVFKEGTKKTLKEVFFKNSSESFPFLINEQNEFIFNNDIYSQNFILKENSAELQKIISLKNGSFTRKINNRWYVFKEYKEWNWFLVYSIDINSKYKELHLFRNEFILTAMLILLIISLSISLIVKYFITPISRLNDFTKNIAAGELDGDISIKAGKELSELASNFNIMKNNINNNIVSLKNNEEEIQELNSTLEQKVYLRTSELAESNDELEQTINNLKDTQDKLIESEKMASLGGLVAGVAHEINTPVGISLTGITHFLSITEALEKDYLDEKMSKEEFEDYLETSKVLAQQININLERTANLVRSFKQISVDQTSEEQREFELESYFEDTIFSLKSLLKRNKITVNLKVNEKITINSYPGAYSQIITNLIQNTVKHAYASQKDKVIDIEVLKQKSSIEILFKDYGKGISKINLEKIFNPFFTTNRKNGGTGLGLNIVYNIVTSNLKGEIKCLSEEGKGTQFLITIPCK